MKKVEGQFSFVFTESGLVSYWSQCKKSSTICVGLEFDPGQGMYSNIYDLVRAWSLEGIAHECCFDVISSRIENTIVSSQYDRAWYPSFRY